MRASVIVLVLLSAAASPSARAESPDVVAVFDVELSGVRLSADERRTLFEYLHTKVAAAGRFSVVPRAEVAKRLRRAKAESYKECYDEACQIEIGKELAAQKTVSTKVLRIGDACAVSIVVYDLRTAASAGAADATGGCGIAALVRSVEKAVVALSPAAPRAAKRIGEPDPKRCPLPGTQRVGAGPPEGRNWYCVDDQNRRHGLAAQYHANGEVASRIEYRDGEAHGAYERFHENGQVAERGRSERGRRVGTWTRWSRRGVKTDEGPYVDGVKQGEWTRYHGQRGYKYEVERYAKDMKNGPAATFAEDGELRYEGQHVDGERSGTWRFYRDGKLSAERTYVKGVEEGVTRHFGDDGEVRSTQEYRGGKKEGAYQSWGRSDGKRYLDVVTRYVADAQDGVRKDYRSDGLLERETTYRAGKKHGRYVEFGRTKDGAAYARLEGQYEDDAKHGAWKSFDPDGTLRREERYVRGKRVKDERKPRSSSRARR